MQTIFDLSEDFFSGGVSGWVQSLNNQGVVVPDAAVTLIPGLLTTKHTVIHTANGDGSGVERADLQYTGSATPAPAGADGVMAVGSVQWWRFAVKTDPTFVPQLLGGVGGRFNTLMDFHGNSVAQYTPVAVEVNATTMMVALEVNGGNAVTPTDSRYYDMFPFVAGDVLDFKIGVKWAPDSTGWMIVRCSRNGGAYETYVDAVAGQELNRPNMAIGETGGFLKLANYRSANKDGGTAIVWHSGMIRGDIEPDLVLQPQPANVMFGQQTIGATTTACSAGTKRAAKFTAAQTGTVTHLVAYVDTTGVNATPTVHMFTVYADNLGAPGAKLAQTRVRTVHGTDPSGWAPTGLVQSLQVTAGKSYWVGWSSAGSQSAQIRFHTDATGSSTFASDTDTIITSTGGPSDPFGTSTAGNPDLTLSIYALGVPQATKTLISTAQTSLSYTIEIAFANNPADPSLTWTDITTYCRGFSYARGRQHELNKPQAGTGTIKLLNTSRVFEPAYSGSPYYPNVVPMKPIRLRIVLNGVQYIPFTHFVERWPQTRTGPSYAEQNITTVDGFELLSNATLPGASYPQELTGTRVNRALDAVGWPAAMRSISPGQSQVQAYTFAASDGIIALNHIQDVETAEAGIFFIAGNGYATFIDRLAFQTSPYGTSQAVISDRTTDTTAGTSILSYAKSTPSYDKDLIVNLVDVTPTGIATQEAIDSSSQTEYFVRGQQLTPPLTSTTDALALAQYLVYSYKQPLLRHDSIVFTPGQSSAAWLELLLREIGDRITVLEHPPGGGAAYDADERIQYLHVDVPTDAHGASCEWSTFPGALGTFLVLDDSTLGKLDSSNAFGY